jgi:hypothetical protein
MPNSKPLNTPPSPKPCACTDANTYACLAVRHQTSIALARIMNGCSCSCHLSVSGAEISHTEWKRKRRV